MDIPPLKLTDREENIFESKENSSQSYILCLTEAQLLQRFSQGMKNTYTDFTVVSKSGISQNPLLEHCTCAP